MAERKSGPGNRPAGKSANRPAAKAPAKGGSGSRPPAGKATAAKATAAKRPPAKKPGKSIVNQKQTPWGLIAVTAAIVVFAVAVVGVVIATRKSDSGNSCTQVLGKKNAQYPYLAENKCASQIKGVTFKSEASRHHVTTPVTYDSTPPVGGNHSAYWADCTGTVYPAAIANENAVHMLEHGAVWITYNAKTLPAADLPKLESYVQGKDHTAMSPYPNLKTPISLQAWGYQLFLSSPSDPRIAKFISVLRANPQTTPEQGGVCSQPTFIAHPSTFGNPLYQPATS